MRSTRATAALSRLNVRCPDQHYTLSSTATGLFFLSRQTEAGEEQVCAGMPLDEFVAFVNGLGPQTVRRVTRNDAAFEKQLIRKPRT
jgi:hypothetical protein